MKTRTDLMAIEGFDTLAKDTSGNPCVWENFYSCEPCLNSWTDTWSCQCDDECPDCGRSHEPISSTWIGPSDSTLRALWEALPEAGSGESSPLYGRARRPSFTIAELATLLVELGPESEPNPLYLKIKKILEEELNPAHREMVDAYRGAVEPRDGQCEMDCDAEVSFGDDPGAYVMVWTWVPAEDAGFMPEEDEDDLLNSIADERADEPTTLTKLEEL